MGNVFVSYAREDEDRVAALVSELERLGWRVFWDRRIGTGAQWRDTIGKALHEANCVVVVWTRQSIEKFWVAEEAEFARKRGILLPVALDQVEPPIGFQGIQVADLSNWSPGNETPSSARFFRDVEALLARCPGPGVSAPALAASIRVPKSDGLIGHRPRLSHPVAMSTILVLLLMIAGGVWVHQAGTKLEGADLNGAVLKDAIGVDPNQPRLANTDQSTVLPKGTTRTAVGECLLTPTEDTGWVDATRNDCKIQGAWYAYNDCETSPGDCTKNQVPLPGRHGFANTGAKMCTSGTTALKNKKNNLKWGAGIALNLNQPTDSEDRNPISALPHALTGFSFTISGPRVPSAIFVTYPTAATEKTGHFKKITKAGDYTVLFTDVQQGSWVTGDNRINLNVGDVVTIQFQVQGSDTEAIPFDFCVENLKALY